MFLICTILGRQPRLGPSMLTPKQKQLLLFINERIEATGVPPSFDEMKEALDLKSKSGIHRLIMALEERGFIRRLPHRARALEVMKMPERGRMGFDGERRVRGFMPTVIEGTKRSFEEIPQAPLAQRPRGWRRAGAGDGPDRGRRSKVRNRRPEPRPRHAARVSLAGRAFCAGSARRFHDRGRASAKAIPSSSKGPRARRAARSLLR